MRRMGRYTRGLLVAPLRILLVVLGDTDHMRDSDGIQVAESLEDTPVSNPQFQL